MKGSPGIQEEAKLIENLRVSLKQREAFILKGTVFNPECFILKNVHREEMLFGYQQMKIITNLQIDIVNITTLSQYCPLSMTSVVFGVKWLSD